MRAAATLGAVLLAAALFGWNPPKDAAGGISAEILVPEKITSLEQVLDVKVRLASELNRPAAVQVRIGLIDGWRVEGQNPVQLQLPAKGQAEAAFRVHMSPRTYAAHYPIHAYVTAAGRERVELHPVAIIRIPDEIGYREPWGRPKAEVAVLPADGALQLERLAWRVGMATHGQEPTFFGPCRGAWNRDTGGSFTVRQVDRGGVKPAIGMHEPWRKGWGTIWADADVKLPEARPIKLVLFTAIRDHDPEREPPSDGVDFRVYVRPEGGEFEEVFRRFTAAKRWEKAEVDLTRFAGRRITLRLWQGPGPRNDTTCDQAWWGEPTLLSGRAVERMGEEDDFARRAEIAVKRARAALRGRREGISWQLRSLAGRFGAAIVPGPAGLADAAIAFCAGERSLVFRGINISVDDSPLGGWRSEVAIRRVEVKQGRGGVRFEYSLASRLGQFRARVRVWEEKGALRFEFSMPGVRRTVDGHPRFTAIYLGPASDSVERLYAGFGNVMVPSGPVEVRRGGFALSTRHAGADFRGGLSLVQASTIFPDAFVWIPDEQRCSLICVHDTTLTLVPSERGAFAAARVYRDIAGYRPTPAYRKIVGRMCLDRWGGTYADCARDLRRAAAYGLTHSVFLKHVWQRWGYDYRLPDIYPPNPQLGTFEEFMDMVRAAKSAGMLFAVHDNYIDFYPDATGFSYRHIIFNADGRPQRAWYNRGRDAQSYRWLPHAFMPWLERNLRLIKRGFAPTAYFIDVFTAIPPIDYYDQQGRYYPRTWSVKWWGRAFDRVRQILGNAPTISEAGHDGLIGHLDAGEADHYDAWRWTRNLKDAERVPWHDMVTHGSFVLLGGGLGSRYSNGNPRHGYGTDDYLSITVLGGRNPMCDGPCFRRTVLTYWMLHDVCDRLARAEILAHEFAGGDIHRQHVVFSGGGEVWANRGKEAWVVEGFRLPQYGFLARAGECVAWIAERDGVPARFSKSPGAVFVDARAPYLEIVGEPKVKTRVLGGRIEGQTVTLRVEWEILQALPEGERIFVHVCHPRSRQGEKIALFGRCDLAPENLQRPGRYTSRIVIQFPEDAWTGEWFVRYGLWNPRLGGRRTVPMGPVEGSRVRGGRIVVEKRDGRSVPVRYIEPPAFPGEDEPNREKKVIDFGPVSTNGAFRLVHRGDLWRLVPLPGSLAFEARIDLGELGAGGRRVRAVRAVKMDGSKAQGPVKWEQRGDVLEIAAGEPVAFAYVIEFAGP